MALSLDAVAHVYADVGRNVEAEALYRRSLVIKESVFGREHPDFATSLNNLATFSAGRQDWSQAFDMWSRSTSILTRRVERASGTRDVEISKEAEKVSWRFNSLVKVGYRLKSQGPQPELRGCPELC